MQLRHQVKKKKKKKKQQKDLTLAAEFLRREKQI